MAFYRGFGRAGPTMKMEVSLPNAPATMPSRDDIEWQHKQLLEFFSQAYEKATAYENIIVVGGYAAFFALWSGVSHDISRPAALWAVCLMSISLISYLTFHVLMMVTRSVSQIVRLKPLMAEKTVQEKMNAIEAMGKPAHSVNAVMVLWPVSLMICVVTGVPAAALVAINAISVAFGRTGWPT